MARPAVALLLFCLLMACDRPPASAARVAPPTPPIQRAGEEEAVGIFKKTLERHRFLFKRGVCGNSSGWFADEHSFYRTDGRMFAQAFPALAERLALAVLNDPQAPQPDRLFAWFILEVLAPRTCAALEDFLAGQVDSLPDERRDERELALKNLIRRRFDDRMLAFCRAQARKGSGTAKDALSTVVDPEAIRLFQEINAGDMLERIAVLQSKNGRETLWHILMGKKRNQYPLNFLWALEAANGRRCPNCDRPWNCDSSRSGDEARLRRGALAPTIHSMISCWWPGCVWEALWSRKRWST